MNEIYVTGHRNPDVDSVCSAYAYAQLKNMLSDGRKYIPVRCGHLSENVKKQFSYIDFVPPPYMRDIYPKVSDVMLSPSVTLDADDPIYNLVKIYSMKQPSVIPVTEKGKFYGLLSLDDITSWFLKDNRTDYPEYDIPVRNISSVIPGKVFNYGEKDSLHVRLLAGAAAFDEFCSFISDNEQSMVVIGLRKKHIEYAIKQQVPSIIITTSINTGDIDFSSYKGFVYVTTLGTAETLRRLRMVPSVRGIMGKQGRAVQCSELFDDAKDFLSESSLRGLPVFDGEKWTGFITRRCFLRKPRYSVIMVDHNEIGQSIRGIEEADVVEIIDHHRIDSPKTDKPIFINVEPLGSTCTIVYRLYVNNGIMPDYITAKVLLTGIICDTLILKSPTTTVTDKESVKSLAKICKIRDVEKFGKELFSFSESLSSRVPADVINSDFKIYTENSVKVGVGQCEVPFLRDLDDYKEKYLEALESVRKSNNLQWSLLLVTDVLRGNSILLSTESKYERKLSYQQISSHVYNLPGILSRKKQLLPEIMHTLS